MKMTSANGDLARGESARRGLFGARTALFCGDAIATGKIRAFRSLPARTVQNWA
jgi:hypothetical protein